MINLHEHLSEFSYGYGITREVEVLLASVGLQVTPFLPNLVHEAQLGFDVAFAAGGTVIVLQFKLGQELRRFRRAHPSQPIPALVRPFWRFAVDLDSNQFQRLAEYEAQGAQAYYTAPRFSDWRRYAGHFQNGEVLENSLLVRPSDVVTAAGPSGKHRVVYDRYHRYVCSEPRPIAETRPEEFVERVAADVRKGGISLSERLRRLVERPSELEPANLRSSRRRLSGLEERAKRPEDAWAARLGLDVWTQGAQLIMVTDATVSVS